jgi:hypothetical protein
MALLDFLPLSLQLSSTLLSASSQFSRGESYRSSGAARQAASEFEAKQLDIEAEQAVGIGMRGAADETRKARLVESAALARAAASGAGASDPTVMNIIARTAGEGAYRASVAMYEGEAQARLDRLRAAGARYEGAVAAAGGEAAGKSSDLAGASTLLTGGLKAVSLYDKYWSGPKADTGATLSASPPRTTGSWLDAGTEAGDTA